MNPRADPPVGHPAARVTTTTRRGTPWQDRSPSFLWPPAAAGIAAFSPGHPPAHPRHAISTREHQTGGAPTRSAPTRGGYPTPGPRRPSLATGSPAASRPYVLALTRCGRCVLTRRAAGACPAPAGEPSTQWTNQYSIAVVLDSAVPHQETVALPLSYEGARAQSTDLPVHPRWQGVARADLGYPCWLRRPMTTRRAQGRPGRSDCWAPLTQAGSD